MRTLASFIVLCVTLVACEQPPASALQLGGTVSGLRGTGLVLTNGEEALAIEADGAFVFATSVSAGAPFTVTVATQPTSPTQRCVVEGGAGVASDATNIVVTCMTDVFLVGGTVTGLAGRGLVLQNNADEVAISADGTFTFPTPVASGAAFEVTVKAQPSSPRQTCVVAGGTGTVAAANVTSVTIDCTTDSFAIGGTVSGLVGAVVLQNNAGDDLPVTANGTFSFATPVLSGATYDVSVLTQPGAPVTQTCAVSAGAGTITNAAITTVHVHCTTNVFTVGGTATGLAPSQAVVLQLNGGTDLTISGDGAFTFPAAILSGASYIVTVLSTTTTPVSQTCAVTNAAGTLAAADITDVVVTCAPELFTIGVTVIDLAGTGLVLQNNGVDTLSISGNGTFTFTAAVASGLGYNVTILSNPTTPPQVCRVLAGVGLVVDAAVTSVVVKCVPRCAQLVTNANVWGVTARGIDLRRYTNSTLDWIGCPFQQGCHPQEFFCNDEPNRIFFGTSGSILRSLADPGNAAGEAFPTTHNGCCYSGSPRSLCNAPIAANSGVGGINSADALCKAMGFASGVVVSERTDNACPRPHATTADGSNWTVNFSLGGGYGRQYRCTH